MVGKGLSVLPLCAKCLNGQLVELRELQVEKMEHNGVKGLHGAEDLWKKGVVGGRG